MPDSGRGLPALGVRFRLSPRHSGGDPAIEAGALPSARSGAHVLVIELKFGEIRAPVSTADEARGLARWDRLLSAVVVEAPLGLAAEPAGLDVFHQQRAGAVLRVREALVE